MSPLFIDRSPKSVLELINLSGVEAGTSFYIHNDIFRYQEEVYEELVQEKPEQVIEPTQNGISHHHDLQAHGDAPEPEFIQNK